MTMYSLRKGRIPGGMQLTVAGLLSAALWAGHAAPAAGKPGDRAGVVAVARGGVTRVAYDVAVRNPRSVGRNVSTGQRILLGDVIATGPRGRLQILLMDQTMFTIGPNSRMTIDEFVYNPRNNSGKLSATISRGVFRFISGKIATTQPQNVKIKTPVATLAIRGTSIFGIIRPARRAFLPGRQNAQLPLSSGESVIGVLGAKEGNKSSSILVTTSTGNKIYLNRAGVAVKFDPTSGQSTVFKVDPATLQNLMRQIGTVPAGGGGNPNQGGGQNGGGSQNGNNQPGGSGNPATNAGSNIDVGSDAASNTIENLNDVNNNISNTSESAQTATSLTNGVTKVGELLAITTGSISGTTVTQLTAITGSGSATNTATFTIDFANRTRSLVTQTTNLTTAYLGGPSSSPVVEIGPFPLAGGKGPNENASFAGTRSTTCCDTARSTTFFNTSAGVARKFTTTLIIDDRNGNVLKGTSSGTMK